MSQQAVTIEDCGKYACITLKEGELNARAQEQIRETLRQSIGRHAAIVLTGSGATFCTGAGDGEGAEYSRQGHGWSETIEAIRRHPAVFIAAVNGAALGEGVALINVCDLAFIAESAEIGLPQITRATYPAIAGPSTQLRILRKHASWLLLTGRGIDGRTAARWGLVNAALPADQVLMEAKKVAGEIAGFNPVTLDWSRKAIDDIPAQVSDWTAALEYGRVITTVIQNQIGKENFMPKKF